MRSASLKLSAPTGSSMNSWKSSGLSAWAPPLMTLIMGTGSTRAWAPPMCRHSGMRWLAAAARATASDAPSSALAPSRLLPGVPSSAIMAVSMRTAHPRSEEHTSELQSPCNLVCRLLLEKKKYDLDERVDSPVYCHQDRLELPDLGAQGLPVGVPVVEPHDHERVAAPEVCLPLGTDQRTQ